MPEFLFIYGTLHPDRAPAEIVEVARTLRPLGPATVRGSILDLGTYPGLILSEDGREVGGNLFSLPYPAEETWKALDHYEDFRADDPAGSLYLRVRTVAVVATGERVDCWVYVYNR